MARESATDQVEICQTGEQQIAARHITASPKTSAPVTDAADTPASGAFNGGHGTLHQLTNEEIDVVRDLMVEFTGPRSEAK